MSTHCDDALPSMLKAPDPEWDSTPSTWSAIALGLPVRVGGPQNQVVGDGGQLRNVEDEDIRGLLVEHGLRNGKGRGL